MAIKRKTKSSTPARRRPATKKQGLSTGAKFALGAGVIAGVYLIYDNFLKVPPVVVPPLPPNAEDLIDKANSLPENTVINKPPEKPRLTPIGTPEKNQSWNKAKLFYGDKGGEIETMQKLFNRVSKLYNQPIIKIDGNWGPATEAKKIKIMGTGTGFNLMNVYNVVKANEAKVKTRSSFNPEASASTILMNATGGFNF